MKNEKSDFTYCKLEKSVSLYITIIAAIISLEKAITKDCLCIRNLLLIDSI